MSIVLGHMELDDIKGEEHVKVNKSNELGLGLILCSDLPLCSHINVESYDIEYGVYEMFNGV